MRAFALRLIPMRARVHGCRIHARIDVYHTCRKSNRTMRVWPDPLGSPFVHGNLNKTMAFAPKTSMYAWMISMHAWMLVHSIS